MSDRPFLIVFGSGSAAPAVPHDWHIVTLDELPLEPFDLAPSKLAVLASTTDDEEALLLAGVRGCSIILHFARGVPPPDEQFLEDLGRVVDTAPPADPTPLDLTQLELLRRLAEGLTLVDAARDLGLSRRTAMRRLADARRRLGVSSTMMAIRVARDAS